MTKNKKVLLLLDGSHLAYRAYYKFMNMKTLDGVKTSVIYGMPFILESLLRKFQPDKSIIAFDGGRSKFRTDLLPSYKQRDKKLDFDSEDFFKQRDEAINLIESFGMLVSYKKGYEADDLIAYIAIQYERKGYTVIIVSGDKDFNQLISDNIYVWNSQNGERYNKVNLFHKVGYHPNQCVDYLCIMGDHSDNIKGYPGMGEKRTAEFITTHTSIRKFLRSKDNYKKLDKTALEAVWKFNRQLIDLKYFYRKVLLKELLNIPYNNHVPFFNKAEILKICRKYEINSFIKPQFLETFKSLYDETVPRNLRGDTN
jgi:DNA polymerase I